jgi:hypothetical protein
MVLTLNTICYDSIKFLNRKGHGTELKTLSSTIQVTCNVRGCNVSLKNVVDAIYYAIIKLFNILIFIICEEVGFGSDNAQKLALGATQT